MKVKWHEVGSCRGDNFSNEGEFDLDEVIKQIETLNDDCSLDDLEVFRDDDGFPFNIFYNKWRGGRKEIKEILLKALKAVKAGETVIECWEEGTTGMSAKLSEEDLVKEVEAADYESIKGGDGGNLDTFL